MFVQVNGVSRPTAPNDTKASGLNIGRSVEAVSGDVSAGQARIQKALAGQAFKLTSMIHLMQHADYQLT
ncbi:hypothetical protein ACIBL3_25090 [Kribbella sp. NPDC050124]|uniref:hypothetical protein n=1 Tax=Kribbella sp. NPDC050124 TaxID=3364114 RepID=UPI0037A271DE